MDYKQRYEEWVRMLPEGDPLKDELLAIKDDDNEIKERFYQNLAFGTVGLRGIVGAGTNRMNFYTVGKASQGVAEYICAQGQEAMDKGIVIAHDPRHFSKDSHNYLLVFSQRMELKRMYSQTYALRLNLRL